MSKSKNLLVWAILGLLGICAITLAKVVRAEAVLRFVSNFTNVTTSQSATALEFELQIVDSSNAGDCKMVGDIDGDGYPDLILGGSSGEDLVWYRYPDWEKTVITIPATEFTTDGALGDVDGDGDLDIVLPDGNSGSNFVWFENPLPAGDSSQGGQWARHIIGTLDGWGKDVELADFDADGRLDAAVRTTSTAMIFFQTASDRWSKTSLSSTNTGEEGLASGDINGDGKIDLVLQGVWLRNPGGMSARSPDEWQEFSIGSAHSAFKALVVDLDRDGSTDVLFSSSEGTAPVEWWSPVNGDPTGSWTKHTILPLVERAHTLQTADMDLDGDLDVVVGQMHTSGSKELMILFNEDGQANSWVKQVLAKTGIHNGVVADIGADGDYDIYGANWTGNPPARVWINKLDPSPGWTYLKVTSTHAQTFGLDFGDLDSDGWIDILSGLYWYKNPGGDLTGVWKQSGFPTGMHAILSLDVDGDGRVDVIAQKDEGDLALYWLKAKNEAATDWEVVKVGSVEAASHTLGAQGYRVGQIEAGGKPEIAISSGNGIYYFRIPSKPSSGNWPKVHISDRPSDEGFALGDIDTDGDFDLAATTGETRQVEWYENPGNGTANWGAHTAGFFSEAVYPDRTEIADLNKDGFPDIIVTEENGEPEGAESYWWEQPPRPGSDPWTAHRIVSQGTTNSLDAADMDGDGDTDLVLAEHRGALKLAIWSNNGKGDFTEQVVWNGKESHLGARTVDLDGDGDLEIVSIAWDTPGMLHLWRNDIPADSRALTNFLYLPVFFEIGSP